MVNFVEIPMEKFPHIHVVDASAGSGKTEKLALRAVNLIFAKGIREMLAITFTNDATREMRQRILETLKKAALEDGDSGKGEKVIGEILKEKIKDGLNAGKVKKEAALAIDGILRNYLDFRVSTIDSFVNRVCAASALEIGFPPRYEVVMDAQPYIEYAVDYLVSGIGSREDAREFGKFIESYLTIEDQKSWNPRDIILKNVTELRKREGILGSSLQLPEHGFGTKGEFEKAKKAIMETFETKEIPRFESEFKGTEDKKEKARIEKLTEKVRDALNEGDPGKLKDRKMDELLPATQKALSDFYYRLSSSRYSEYLKMLDRVKAELESIRHKESIVFVDELNTEVRKFIAREGIVPQIYCMLGETIRHYLIDEFQDTSDLQWDNFRPLIENGLSEGGSLFYVGDRKQAIFRFRGGNPRLFSEARESFRDIVEDISEQRLEENYRSKKEIVEANNGFFSGQNLKKAIEGKKLEKEIEEVYRDVKQEAAREDPDGGIFSAVRFKAANKEDLYEKLKAVLLPVLKGTLKKHKPEEVAFLVMSNEETEILTAWLSEQGFQAESQVTMDIRKNRVTQEIISFLKFLGSPADNFSLSSFLSGDIFRRAAGITREESYARLNALKDERIYYTAFRKTYPAEWKTCFEHFFKKAGFLPPYDLVSEFLKVYNVLQNFPGSESFVMRLLEFINQLEKKGENSLRALLDYWVSSDEDDDSFQLVLPSCPDAIKVKTIFKAKGLGFPVVFMVFLPHTVRDNSFLAEENGRMTMKYITKEYAGFCPGLREEYEAETKRKFFDEFNELYVGMTRAKDELRAFICETHQSNELAALAGTEQAPAAVPATVAEGPAENQEGYARKKPASDAPAVPAERIKDTPGWGRRISRRVSGTEAFKDPGVMERKKRGEFIHGVLSSINGAGEITREFMDEKLKAAAERQRYAGDLKEAGSVLAGLFRDERVRKWFSAKGENEKEVVSGKGETFRMDRVVCSEGLVEIIDFKSGGADKEKHLEQVRNYIRLVSEAGSGRTVKGYIVYIEENRVVEAGG